MIVVSWQPPRTALEALARRRFPLTGWPWRALGHLLTTPPVALAAAVSLGVLALPWLYLLAQGTDIRRLPIVGVAVAVLLGAVLLGEGVATPAETWFLLAGAAITATAGVIALARHHPDAAAARAARPGPGEAASPPAPEAPLSTPDAPQRPADPVHRR